MKEFKPLSKVIYPENENERDKLKKLESLFKEWYEHAKGIDLKVKDAVDFIYDGFFPYYFNQKIKILYIGRETREIDDDNYIEHFYKEFKLGKISIFHERMFYLTYAINNNFPDWHDIPEAKKIAESFAQENGISFAFMNLSKFMNDDEHYWQANMGLIDSFLESVSVIDEKNKSNFLIKEINILDPDLIVTMNLSDLEGRITKYLGVKPIKLSGDLSIYEFNAGTKRIPLFDTFHFSAWKKNDITELYEPIKKAWKEYNIKK